MSRLEEQVDRVNSDLSVARAERDKLRTEAGKHKTENEVRGSAWSNILLIKEKNQRIIIN